MLRELNRFEKGYLLIGLAVNLVIAVATPQQHSFVHLFRLLHFQRSLCC